MNKGRLQLKILVVFTTKTGGKGGVGDNALLTMFISISDQNMKVNVRESNLGEIIQKGDKFVYDLKQFTQVEVYFGGNWVF